VSANSRNGAAPRLSDGQRNEYQSLKLGIVQDVKTGLHAFQRAGEKLLKIREDRLYREEFGTFEEFSREILGHSKTYSNNLIVGFQVVQALVAQGETVSPDSERVARQLAKYPKGDRIFIWKRALQIGGKKKPDYKVIREAATQIVPTKAVQKIWMGQSLRWRFSSANSFHAHYKKSTWIQLALQDDYLPVCNRLQEGLW
jgi:hypothetical protein